MLHDYKGSDIILQALDVVVHASGLIHVRKFQHYASELVVVFVDSSPLGKVLEAVIGTDGVVDQHEL